MNVRAIRLAIAAALLLCSTPVRAQELAGLDLTDLSLEELMNVEVSLATRSEEPLFQTPAAVFVLTREDIRRSGATNLPEALRLVPGVQVARADANKWAVSARGFNGRFATKLLVLIDGRSVYSPLFSGVFWALQDLMLEDVERIEVIRGPGAALWGANAVNGIINVVTRSAHLTQGSLAILGLGTEERGAGSLRYGGKLGESVGYRVYAKRFARNALVDATGKETVDDWDMQRAGLRADWEPHGGDTFSFQGSLYRGHTGQTYRVPILEPPYRNPIDADTRRTGGHLLTCWKRIFSPTADLRLQLYYDRTHWRDILFTEERDTYDLDFQHRFPLGRHQFVWGLGYRYSADQTAGSAILSFDPAARALHQPSAFAQDEIVLLEDRLRLILGAKFERNTYTGFDYQPNLRLLWTPQPNHTLWAAAGRAIRLPARADVDVRLEFQTLPPDSLFPGSPTTLALVLGGGDALKAERVHAFELGYRLRPTPDLFVDLAAFYNDYADLRLSLIDLPYREDDHLVLPAPVGNPMSGQTRGFELAAEWELAAQQGRLRAAYSYLVMDMRPLSGFVDLSQLTEGESPDHQFYLWSSLNPRPFLRLDSILRYVDPLPTPGIDRYLELDLRLAWQPRSDLEIALTGRNLLHDHHPEFRPTLVDILATETQRSAHATLAWSF